MSVALGGITPPAPRCAVAHVGRDDQRALAADLHACHAFVPALDDTSAAEEKVERFACDRANCRIWRPYCRASQGRKASRCSGLLTGFPVDGFCASALFYIDFL